MWGSQHSRQREPRAAARSLRPLGGRTQPTASQLSSPELRETESGTGPSADLSKHCSRERETISTGSDKKKSALCRGGALSPPGVSILHPHLGKRLWSHRQRELLLAGCVDMDRLRRASLHIHLPGSSRACAGTVWRSGKAAAPSLGPHARLPVCFPVDTASEGGPLQQPRARPSGVLPASQSVRPLPGSVCLSHTLPAHPFSGVHAEWIVHLMLRDGDPDCTCLSGIRTRLTGLSLGRPHWGAVSWGASALPQEAGFWAPPLGHKGDTWILFTIHHPGLPGPDQWSWRLMEASALHD